jgi:cell division protein FtsI (penicillin-binding protein 3)
MTARPASVTQKVPFAPSRWVKVRLYLSAGLVACAFGGLCWRAYVLQVRESERLKQMAEDQYLKDVELPPKRGRILDRNGAELAASAEVDSVHVNARMLLAADRVGETARALAEALHLDRRELEKKLRARRYFTWVKRRIPPDEARAVRELALPGVYIDREPRRYYPNRGLAGPLLGWAGLDARGQEGIELQYEKWLRGSAATLPGLRDALGRAVMVDGLNDAAGDVAGHDLDTTIDRYIQFRLERALERGVTQHKAKAGVAVALDPNNGEVLAMAAVPSLNPNEPDGARERGARNRAVTDPFEPGSTMKVFTIAGALESHAIRVDDNWFCENGHIQIAGKTIHDAEPIGEVTTTGVLAKSSNVCSAKIAAKEGREKLREMLLRFGFGRPTGVDLPGEIRAVERMGPVETATMAFGQGLTATPLQVAAAYAAVANGGTWYRPHVMRRVVGPDGQVAAEARVDGRRVIAPELAETMRTMLHAVSLKGGTAQKLSVPGYLFAGKTGTAQKVDPMTRHYSPEKWVASFAGFAPLDHPRLMLFVMIDEPYGSHHGSDVAGPIWQDVMIDALRWLGVPPTEPLTVAQDDKKKPAPAPEPPTVDDADDASEAQPVVDDGDGRARLEVPDFAGMSLAEALQAARRAGLRLEIEGSGRASAQSPGPGATRQGAVCKVSFTPPG